MTSAVRSSPCRPSGPNGGDVTLRTASWSLTRTGSSRCDREDTGPPCDLAGGVNIENIATVSAVDSRGDGRARPRPPPTWMSFVPGDRADQAGERRRKAVDDRPPVATVTYTYAVKNAGNTPLGTTTLVDNTAPCETPHPWRGHPGNNDNTLDVGETWTYLVRGRRRRAGVVNTATVTATPLNPLDGNAPFDGDNPAVTDTDPAAVSVARPRPGRSRRQSTSTLVFAGTDGDLHLHSRPNTGRRRPPQRHREPGMGHRQRVCAGRAGPAGDRRNVGDGNANGLLNPGETWEFTCSNTIDRQHRQHGHSRRPSRSMRRRTRSEAHWTRHRGHPCSSRRPGHRARPRPRSFPWCSTRTRRRCRGPDAPTPRPAEYLVRGEQHRASCRSGTSCWATTACDDVTFVDGDTDGDGILDVTEVWSYTCADDASTGAGQRHHRRGRVGPGHQHRHGDRHIRSCPVRPTQIGPDVSDSDSAQVQVIEPGLTHHQDRIRRRRPCRTAT